MGGMRCGGMSVMGWSASHTVLGEFQEVAVYPHNSIVGAILKMVMLMKITLWKHII